MPFCCIMTKYPEMPGKSIPTATNLNPMDAPVGPLNGKSLNVTSTLSPFAKPFIPASKKSSAVDSNTDIFESKSLLQAGGVGNAIFIITNCDEKRPNVYSEVLSLAFPHTGMINLTTQFIDDKTITDFKKIGKSFTALKQENLIPYEKLLKSETFLYAIFDHKKVRKSISMNDLLNLAAVFFGFCTDVSNAVQFRKKYIKWRGLLPRFGGIVLNDTSTKVLMIRANKRSNFGFPRGKAEAFEIPQKSAQREVMEEIGVNIDISAFKSFDKISVKPRKTLHHYFPVNINEQTKLTLQKNEIQKALWVDINDIDKDGNFPNPDSQTKSLKMQQEPLVALKYYKLCRMISRSRKIRPRVNQNRI